MQILDSSDNVDDGTRVTRVPVGPEALTDPDWVVPPVPQDVPEGTMAWLRAHVARFSSGDAHTRRRALAVGPLAGLDGGPLSDADADANVAASADANANVDANVDADGALRAAARVRAEELLRASGTVEVMSRVARVVPAEVLAASLGLAVTAETAALVGDVARAYHAHGETVPAADRALTRLVAVCGGTWDEATAARIGLLVQAHDATAGLIGNAAHLMLVGDAGVPWAGRAAPPGPVPVEDSGTGRPVTDPVTDRLDQALRTDPPVRGTLRAPVDGGEPVRISLVSPDGSLAFGAGAHACPGRAQARALAAGVLDALRARGCRLAGPEITYEPSANLRVPTKLEVTCG
ncbi:hypothetical protein [Streptomyces sp. NPDC052496]|uniref:hypothetical protein n=1 Tax=Streptomyces sp. NPDC052496 TaxID=3154951 RepID=UPI0034142B74